MKFYRLTPKQQRRSNWLIHRWVDRSDGVPDYVPLPPYQAFVCRNCRRIDYDRVFDVGFKTARKMGGKGDFLTSDDGFHCARENVVQLITSRGIPGARFAQIAETEWYVINITRRVPVTSDVYFSDSPACSECGSPRHVGGWVSEMRQFIESPPIRSLFSTVGYTLKEDRELMIDSYLLDLLLEAGITGAETGEILPAGRSKPHYVDLDDPKHLRAPDAADEIHD